MVRRKALIQIDGVRGLVADGVPFRVRYDLVGTSAHGQPQYQAIYEAEIDGELADHTLVGMRSPKGGGGFKVRVFNLWSGLFVYHHQEHPDLAICLAHDWTVRVLRQDDVDALAARDAREWRGAG